MDNSEKNSINEEKLLDDLEVRNLFTGVNFIVPAADRKSDYEDFETTSDNEFPNDIVEVECETFQTETYPEIKKKLISITENGKVKKLVVRKGSGKCPVDGSTVYMHYISYIEHDEVPYDSTYTRGIRPEKFKIGVGQLYEGLEIAVKSMKQEELSFFLIDSDLAFKELGVPPRIPGNARICIEVELINIINTEKEEDVVHVDKHCFKKAYEKSKIFFLRGNNNFNNGDFRSAIVNYKKAEAIFLSCRMQNDEEEFKWKKMVLKISLNLCACFNHDSVGKPKLVCVIVRELLDTVPDIAIKHAKLFFHLGKAKLTLNDFEGAEQNFKKALKLRGDDDELIEYLDLVKKRKSQDKFLEAIDTQLASMQFT